jgi:prolipoprotein diacylglyceryltransferase
LKSNSPVVPLETMSWIIVGCVFGALFGSKILAWIESAPDYWSHRDNLGSWLGGKTIVGGLLGGWIGVEIAKKILGVKQSTGDAFVFPLIAGIAIGRVGCFLTGLADHTHGVHTNLPWAVDFGDGPRHPTQIYEIVFLVLLGVALFIRSRHPRRSGELFRLFIFGYMSFRFLVEFIKPRFNPYLRLSAIQIAALIAVIFCVHWLKSREPVQSQTING